MLCLSGLTGSVPAQPSAASPQAAKHFEARIKVTARLELFLHGAGESGTNLAKLKVLGPPKIIESKPDFPFVLVSPQSPRGGWDPDALNALLDDNIRKY